MAMTCSQQWDDLAPTNRAGVRRCGQCDDDVHLVTSQAEFEARAAAGECVTLQVRSNDAPGRIQMLTGPPLPLWRRLLVPILLLAIGAAAAYALF